MSLLLALTGVVAPPVEPEAPAVTEWLGGGNYDFLDPEYHKKRLAPKVKKVINKIARQAVQKTTQDTPEEAQESSVTSDWVDSLITLLERENIAFKRFYADLLQQQIEEEDEQAIMLMMMEL